MEDLERALRRLVAIHGLDDNYAHIVGQFGDIYECYVCGREERICQGKRTHVRFIEG